MRRLVSLMLISSLVLAGCGLRDSRVNPANWFGKSKSVRVAKPGPQDSPSEVNPLIPRETASIRTLIRKQRTEYNGTPVQSVTNLVIEPSSGGAIIRATGMPLRQGAYDVRLTPAWEGAEPPRGVLTYRMEAVQPIDTAQGTQNSRRVTAARFVSTQTLEAVSEIRVIGAGNIQTSRR